jgi:hypothetical protein
MGPGVLRFWDPFCASRIGDVGFCPGKVGFEFFVFRLSWVARLVEIGGALVLIREFTRMNANADDGGDKTPSSQVAK